MGLSSGAGTVIAPSLEFQEFLAGSEQNPEGVWSVLFSGPWVLSELPNTAWHNSTGRSPSFI